MRFYPLCGSQFGTLLHPNLFGAFRLHSLDYLYRITAPNMGALSYKQRPPALPLYLHVRPEHGTEAREATSKQIGFDHFLKTFF